MRASFLPAPGLLPLFLTASLAAQQGTIPKGFSTVEGNWASTNVLGYDRDMYGSWTLVDATNIGTARLLKGFSLRRDGDTPNNPFYQTRTVTLSIRLAHANLAKVPNGDLATDATWRKTSWVTVLEKAMVLPALTNPPATPPAPFAVPLLFTSPWTYNGADALAVQIRTSPNNLTAELPYPLDATMTTPFERGVGEPVGTGCTPTGKSEPIVHSSYLDNFGVPGIGRWQLIVSQGPAAAPALAMVGASNPDLAFGACTRLYAMPQILLPAGTTGATGYLNFSISFPSQPAYVGLTFYSQMAAYDAGQGKLPFALTAGRKTTYPASPSLPAFAGGIVWIGGNAWPSSLRMSRGMSLIVGMTW
jgi:hypothetical protein